MSLDALKKQNSLDKLPKQLIKNMVDIVVLIKAST